MMFVWLYVMIGLGMASDYYESSDLPKSKRWGGFVVIWLLGPIFFPAIIARLVCNTTENKP